MIGVVFSWNGAVLERIEAKRFASALRYGSFTPASVERHGFLMAFTKSDQYFCGPAYHALFYGHIDNRSALRQQLGLKNGSDAAIYSAAYHRWGDGVDRYVMGNYSTIVCDIPGRSIRVCRSPIKAPALYISRVKDQLIIATTPKAIFATGKVEKVLDDQKIADSLILNYCEETRGWFRNVRRFRRAHWTRLTADSERETCYWRIEEIPPVRFTRDSDYVEAADSLFREGVAASLDGFSRPAVSLSGGLDSQAVAAYTMALRPSQPLLGFTSIPAYEGNFNTKKRFGDERPHVEALARMYPQLQLNWVTADGLDMSHHLQDIFEEALVPPRNAMNLYWIHEIRKFARSRGADVVLDGALGNLGFSYDGTGVIPDLLRQWRFSALAREIRVGGRDVLKTAVRPLLPNAVLALYRRLRGIKIIPASLDWSAIHPDFAQAMRVTERAKELGYDFSFSSSTSSLECRRSILSNAVNEAGDLAYSIERIHGIPSRDPTAYRPLLEFCFAIPPEQYLHNCKDRWLARRLLNGKVPELVLNERRRGKQAADLGERIYGKRRQLDDEIDWLMADDAISAMIDLNRLKAATGHITGKGSVEEARLSTSIKLALTRGLATARFIRYQSKRNL